MKTAKSMLMTVALAALLLFPLSAQAAPGQGVPFQDLQNQIDQLAQDQAAGDQDLQDQIDQEVQNREDGDQGLQDQIDQEVQDREDADQDLQDQIDQEVQDREDGDQDLQDQIDTIPVISKDLLYMRDATRENCGPNAFCGTVGAECDDENDVGIHGYCTNEASAGNFEITSEGFSGLASDQVMRYFCTGELIGGQSVDFTAHIVCLSVPGP